MKYQSLELIKPENLKIQSKFLTEKIFGVEIDIDCLVDRSEINIICI